MYPKNFSTKNDIRNAFVKISSLVDEVTYQKISRIYFDTVKISNLKLKTKKEISKKKRKVVSLSRKEIIHILNLVSYFHSNDICLKLNHGSHLTGCYHPTFNEEDAWRYFDCFIKGNINDKFDIRIEFKDDFIRSLYKDEEGRHNIDSKNFLEVRAKRLPLIRYTIENTPNIYQKIDEKDNLERIYIHRYIDPYKQQFYYVVIASKYRKAKNSPFSALTAFPIFRYNDLLRKIEKYNLPI